MTVRITTLCIYNALVTSIRCTQSGVDHFTGQATKVSKLLVLIVLRQLAR
ncbi:hypothetical protein AB162_160 [Candidatus Palibaumannia cicadellinicola]|uniref:Uncharacterized protein n=1 Tax=Candidatus Palibaumannia cicadellinicola TaxID=186490 RepID=A0A0K2BK17_9GAMM|nr:hypothetical protein AB162_160 [Candidatus Baumannia cicadellinicola]